MGNTIKINYSLNTEAAQYLVKHISPGKTYQIVISDSALPVYSLVTLIKPQTEAYFHLPMNHILHSVKCTGCFVPVLCLKVTFLQTERFSFSKLSNLHLRLPENLSISILHTGCLEDNSWQVREAVNFQSKISLWIFMTGLTVLSYRVCWLTFMRRWHEFALIASLQVKGALVNRITTT